MRKREKDVCGGLRSGRLSGIISPLSLSHTDTLCVCSTRSVCVYIVCFGRWSVCVCVSVRVYVVCVRVFSRAQECV